MSTGRRSWALVIDGRGMSASAGPSLGRRVPWGANFTTGVNVEDTMKKSTAHGGEKEDFCMEVRHERVDRWQALCIYISCTATLQ